jgi:hypothetical protein
MSKFLGILVLLALGYGVYALINHYRNFQADPSAGAIGAVDPGQAPVEEVPTESLTGLPPRLASSLAAAQERGAAGLGSWLKAYRREVADPRLAAIELDYCVLIVRSDPAQARIVFNSVKRRVTADSPLYPRVKRLAPTFE